MTPEEACESKKFLLEILEEYELSDQELKPFVPLFENGTYCKRIVIFYISVLPTIVNAPDRVNKGHEILFSALQCLKDYPEYDLHKVYKVPNFFEI